MNDPRSPLASGATLRGGDFSIEAPPLGMGGFGITYRAHDHRLKRVVAVKEFFPQGCVRYGGKLTPSSGWTEDGLKAQRDRFLEEGRTLARLRHPGIPVIFDILEENETAYLVMEFVEGQTFAQYLSAKQLWFLLPDEALSLIRGAGEALALMHGAQLLHRDLKPTNIMRRLDGQVMLIDFGASRDFLPEAVHTLTVIFTAGYAPLEQYTRSGNHGPYTDVYSLAATLYHLLTGQKPLEAPRRATGEMLSTPHQVNPAISPALSNAVMHGLEIAPGQRPPTVDAFLRELTASQVGGPHDSYSKTVAATAATTYSGDPHNNALLQSTPPNSPLLNSAPLHGALPHPALSDDLNYLLAMTPPASSRRSPAADEGDGSGAAPNASLTMTPAQHNATKISPPQRQPGKIKKWWRSMLATTFGGLKVLWWTGVGGSAGFGFGTLASSLLLPSYDHSWRRAEVAGYLQFDLALLFAMWLGRWSYLAQKRLRQERLGKVKVLDPTKFNHVVLSTVWGAIVSSMWLSVLGVEYLTVTERRTYSDSPQVLLVFLTIWPILWVCSATYRFYRKNAKTKVKASPHNVV